MNRQMAKIYDIIRLINEGTNLGNLIQLVLDVKKMSVDDLAKKMNMTTVEVQDMINNVTPVSMELAHKLQNALKLSANLWIKNSKRDVKSN